MFCLYRRYFDVIISFQLCIRKDSYGVVRLSYRPLFNPQHYFYGINVIHSTYSPMNYYYLPQLLHNSFSFVFLCAKFNVAPIPKLKIALQFCFNADLQIKAFLKHHCNKSTSHALPVTSMKTQCHICHIVMNFCCVLLG